MSVEISEAALADHLLEMASGQRIICAVAGAPGSGKSTLAGSLVDRLNAGLPGTAEVFPMDGFHYDDLYLVPAGLRPRKGSPDTFDVGGLASMLARLRDNKEPTVAVPVFDREIEIARAGARLIGKSVRILVAEGNYLLLDRDPWKNLLPYFDVTVSLDVPESVLRKRLSERWEAFQLSEAEIAAKVEENDLPNGRLVREHQTSADFVIRYGE
ncbi:nucleoside/nucleotide kinase family protein [Roseibium porphyridii]|uniref:Nucleoside/nucleotide kinase family protein n=1 Tax=Roseibium porphyridii TaxID=2866279 RepID=A0ABY8EYW4_9HYPH|nr:MULTISPECIES: nucleoside/nucleotide kinase family protein [Stappiaceae]QFT33007.1 Pantothenate kinase [Labrenzia sp. THAF82]WFE88302.1 nucleoside/nucleotide kinase family protein [Roseibium sp. KMA01]